MRLRALGADEDSMRSALTVPAKAGPIPYVLTWRLIHMRACSVADPGMGAVS
jgi:hypothetical protein